jgi:predicted small lipoprotein YifL
MPRLLILLALSFFLTACGQTGPLYMPTDDPGADSVPPPPDAVTEQPANTSNPAAAEVK